MPILLVKVSDNTSQPDGPYRYKAGQIIDAFDDNHVFTPAELPSGGNFYHVSVTDKTLQEVRAYLQAWRHNPVIEQIGRQGSTRRIQVTSDMVSVTGKNAFIREDVEQLLVDISGTYVDHTQSSFTFDVQAQSIEDRDRIIELINESVQRMQYARRRWYITNAGMTYLAANGGTVSGTAQQVAGYLRDGLLD